MSYQLRLAWKSLRRNPIPSLVMVGGIGLGIAVAMTFVTAHYAMSADPMPHKSGRLVYVQVDAWDAESPWDDRDPTEPPRQMTYIDAMALMQSDIPTHHSAMYRTEMAVVPEDPSQRPAPEEVRMCFGDFFAMFDVPFRHGSAWDRAADEGPEAVVALDARINQRLFGGENSVGRTLRLESRDFRIVGVLDDWNPLLRFYETSGGPFDPPASLFIPFHLGRELELYSSGNSNGWKVEDSETYDDYLGSEVTPLGGRRSAPWLRPFPNQGATGIVALVDIEVPRMTRTMWRSFLAVLVPVVLASCSSGPEGLGPESPSADLDYRLSESVEILLTSEAGDKIAAKENVSFRKGTASGTVITVRPDVLKQTITGIGSSFTESSAFVLAHLEPEKRLEVMEKVYGESGANFSLARTPIGSTDFSVHGKYSYAEIADDGSLEHFSIAPDREGFSAADYPGIKDETFDLLPMIREALAIKAAQADKELKIIASAWTAPPWMKDIDDWYIPGTPENNYQGTGGALKPEYVQTYADYLTRYLDAYRDAGVEIWGLTPVNEPHGNNGQWESMHFTPETQNDFIKNHLGPTLRASDHGDVKLLIYDQNRDGLEHWTDRIFGDPETAPFIDGVAVHWYESTYLVYEDVFDRIHDKFPQFSIIHTEGTIDDLGKPAPVGILDPEGFQESGWFDNDEFWWNDNATDWAYTATWAPDREQHPVYTPVHRYARNIIVSLDHWMEGWIDWNIVLDRDGGPNHVGNFCGAPIMIHTETGQVYYTPIYHVLAQFSRTIRPGDKAVQTDKRLDGLDDDALHASATVNDDKLLSVQLLNTTKQPIPFKLQIGAQHAAGTLAANSLQTVRVQL